MPSVSEEREPAVGTRLMMRAAPPSQCLDSPSEAEKSDPWSSTASSWTGLAAGASDPRGAPLGSLPKHVSMSPSVKDHRVDVTDIVRRVVDAEVDLRVVAERLDGTRVDPREAPIASIAVEYRP